MSRSPEYTQGKRAGIKWAISWLHVRAFEMGDPNAKTILNTAAFNMGVEAKATDGADDITQQGSAVTGETK